jgi:hypothetical protein
MTQQELIIQPEVSSLEGQWVGFLNEDPAGSTMLQVIPNNKRQGGTEQCTQMERRDNITGTNLIQLGVPRSVLLGANISDLMLSIDADHFLNVTCSPRDGSGSCGVLVEMQEDADNTKPIRLMVTEEQSRFDLSTVRAVYFVDLHHANGHLPTLSAITVNPGSALVNSAMLRFWGPAQVQ